MQNASRTSDDVDPTVNLVCSAHCEQVKGCFPKQQSCHSRLPAPVVSISASPPDTNSSFNSQSVSYHLVRLLHRTDLTKMDQGIMPDFADRRELSLVMRATIKFCNGSSMTFTENCGSEKTTL